MKDFRYEELKEIRRGLGVLFLLITTFLGDLVREVVRNPNPLDKEIIAIEIAFLLLIILGIGIVFISVFIWIKFSKKGENDER